MIAVPPPGWITVHDAELVSRRRPARPVFVNPARISSVRPYSTPRGPVNTTICVDGRFLHIAETAVQLFALVQHAKRREEGVA